MCPQLQPMVTHLVYQLYVTRGGDSNIHCSCGRDWDQNAINGSRVLNRNSQKIKSAFWCRTNDREGFLDNQTSIFPCILVHCTGILCTSVKLRKLVILIPVAAASTVHIGVAAPCVLCTFTLSGMYSYRFLCTSFCTVTDALGVSTNKAQVAPFISKLLVTKHSTKLGF